MRQLNVPDNDRAIALLEKAVSLDSHFALAYSALAYEYRTRAQKLTRGDDEWERKSFVAAEKAIELDPDLADGYVSRATILWAPRNHFPHENAILELKHALALNPNSDEAHHQLANIYNHIGLLKRAEDHINQAVLLDPTNPGARFRIAINLIYQGKYEEALARIRDSREFMPSLWAYQTGFALMQLGRRDEVLRLMADAEQKDRTESASLLRSMEALAAASAGDRRTAERKIQEAIRMGSGFQHFHHTEYGVGSAYALMNRPKEALRWLKAAAEDGFPCYPLYARDRNLESLRHDPEFMAFMTELEKQWEHRRQTL
jgi:tetratricopeptide (TPR) repeat protein